MTIRTLAVVVAGVLGDDQSECLDESARSRCYGTSSIRKHTHTHTYTYHFPLLDVAVTYLNTDIYRGFRRDSQCFFNGNSP